jgi:hypothetical protein
MLTVLLGTRREWHALLFGDSWQILLKEQRIDRVACTQLFSTILISSQNSLRRPQLLPQLRPQRS